ARRTCDPLARAPAPATPAAPPATRSPCPKSTRRPPPVSYRTVDVAYGWIGGFERRLCRRNPCPGGRHGGARRRRATTVGRGVRGGVSPSLKSWRSPPPSLYMDRV